MTIDHQGPPSGVARHSLPVDRKSITHKFTIGDASGYITVGLYPNGQPGEIFVIWHKAGSFERGVLDAWATMVSIALQSGCSLRDIVNKFSFWRFEPSGLTAHPTIRMCTSPLDYICKWLELKFLPDCSGKDIACTEPSIGLDEPLESESSHGTAT